MTDQDIFNPIFDETKTEEPKKKKIKKEKRKKEKVPKEHTPLIIGFLEVTIVAIIAAIVIVLCLIGIISILYSGTRSELLHLLDEILAGGNYHNQISNILQMKPF